MLTGDPRGGLTLSTPKLDLLFVTEEHHTHTSWQPVDITQGYSIVRPTFKSPPHLAPPMHGDSVQVTRPSNSIDHLQLTYSARNFRDRDIAYTLFPIPHLAFGGDIQIRRWAAYNSGRSRRQMLWVIVLQMGICNARYS
jgi:hypothetical protein